MPALTPSLLRASLAAAGTQKELDSLYMSENRSLAVLEILVHLSASDRKAEVGNSGRAVRHSRRTELRPESFPCRLSANRFR